jgi:hypothetical protein
VTDDAGTSGLIPGEIELVEGGLGLQKCCATTGDDALFNSCAGVADSASSIRCLVSLSSVSVAAAGS